MTITAATPTMLNWSARWEEAIPSAVLSGINGDVAHQSAAGKHLSRSDNIRMFGSGCWAVVHPKDKLGPSDKACAIDMNMSRGDQNLVHNRLIAVYNNRSKDPRAQYLYAFNGFNGVGLPMRYNVANGATAVTDNSHTWHEHVETYYGYVNDPAMVDAMMSIITGESMAAYIGRTTKQIMASVWDEQIGQNTGLSGRTFRNMGGDIQNLRNWLGAKTGTTGLPWVPETGSPVRALEEIPLLRKEVESLRALVTELRDLVKTSTSAAGK